MSFQTIQQTNPLRANFVTRNARPFSRMLKKPALRNSTQLHFALSDIPTLPAPIAHAVVNFCVLYSTMNWLFYRNVRQSIEKKNDKEKKE